MGFKEVFQGADCKLCQEFGVTCHKVGVFDSTPGESGQVVIYLDKEPVFRTFEGIDQCPAILKENSFEKVATKIRENAEKAKGTIYISQHKVPNY